MDYNKMESVLVRIKLEAFHHVSSSDTVDEETFIGQLLKWIVLK